MLYNAKCFYKHTELDSFENGCQPDTARTSDYDISLEAETLEGLMNTIMLDLEVEASALIVNACGENGRVDIQRMEHEDGEKPDPEEIAKWKKGLIPLWLANYSFYCTRQESITEFPKEFEDQGEEGESGA